MKSGGHKNHILILLLGVTLSACSLFKMDGAQKEVLRVASQFEGGGSEMEFFSANLHQWVQNKECTQCHAESTSPRFAHTQIETSHSAFMTISNFADPGNSTIITKLDTGHYCGANCDNYMQYLTQAIDAWGQIIAASAGSGGGSSGPGTIPPGLLLPEQTIPGNVPNCAVNNENVNNYPLITWDLSGLGAGFPGVFFDIRICQLFDAYKLANPRLRTSTGTYIVQNIRLGLNGGIQASSTTYNFISATVPPPGTTPLTVFQTNLTKINGAGSDRILAVIANLVPSTSPAADYFNTQMVPAMQVSCGNCHNGNQAFAYNDYNTVAFLVKNPNGATATNNTFIVSTNGGNGHPGGNRCGGLGVGICLQSQTLFGLLP